MTTPGTTITNPDELDATPVGVVVRDIDGDLWARNSHPGRRGWTGLTPGCAEATSDDLTDDGPLVVVSVPGALDGPELEDLVVETLASAGDRSWALSDGPKLARRIRTAILGGAA